MGMSRHQDGQNKKHIQGDVLLDDGAASKVNQNVLPWPGSLFTPIVPPNFLTMRWTIGNPRPVPLPSS
jgi:hypothetical protein